MLREGPMPHPATVIRERMGGPSPRLPQFTDLFMLLVQMGMAPDVTFIRYQVVQRYADLNEALADCRPLLRGEWDEAQVRGMLQEILTQDGDELVFDGGLSLSGIAHWKPKIS
jgi:hypothetical protein